MQHKALLISFILFLSFSGLIAQNRSIVRQIAGVETNTSLSFVYGWQRNPQNDKWTTKENEIKGIDKFESYSLISFNDQSKKYIAIIKQYDEKGLLVFDSYILDYEDYVSKISLWEEHSILKFPILKYYQAKLKKGILLTKDVLGLSDLSGLLSSPKDFFVFQYKFSNDNTVKFLFYKESCLAGDCLPSGLNTKPENLPYYINIGTDNLYNNFFYKTMLKYFVEFTDSPIKK